MFELVCTPVLNPPRIPDSFILPLLHLQLVFGAPPLQEMRVLQPQPVGGRLTLQSPEQE